MFETYFCAYYLCTVVNKYRSSYQIKSTYSMKTAISYEEAKIILLKYLTTSYLKLHSIETAAIMKNLALHFGTDVVLWQSTGLLHDLDMDVIDGDYSLHGYKTVALLKSEGYEIPAMFDAIVAHTEGLEVSTATRKTQFDFVLAAAESVTGIVSAYVAIKPDKKIAGTKPSSLMKKLKTKAFAASVNREFISDITLKTGLAETVFLQIAIDSFIEIADEIGM